MGDINKDSEGSALPSYTPGKRDEKTGVAADSDLSPRRQHGAPWVGRGSVECRRSSLPRRLEPSLIADMADDDQNVCSFCGMSHLM